MAPERLLSNTPGGIEDLGYAFQERAAIMEYSGGLPREEAERLAWREVMAQWAVVDWRRGQAKAAGVTSHWVPPPANCYGEAL